jgi:hypothetical protein
LNIGVSSTTNLHLSGTCYFGGTYYLLASANITQLPSLWKPMRTNIVAARGTNNYNAVFTNGLKSISGQEFYILYSP